MYLFYCIYELINFTETLSVIMLMQTRTQYNTYVSHSTNEIHTRQAISPWVLGMSENNTSLSGSPPRITQLSFVYGYIRAVVHSISGLHKISGGPQDSKFCGTVNRRGSTV